MDCDRRRGVLSGASGNYYHHHRMTAHGGHKKRASEAWRRDVEHPHRPDEELVHFRRKDLPSVIGKKLFMSLRSFSCGGQIVNGRGHVDL